MAYIPPLNGGRLNASIGGNSTSAGAGYAMLSTGTMVLAGGNNVTLSQNGQSITISGPNTGGGGIGLAGFGTTYTSGTISLSANGALTLSGSTNSVLSLSVPATSSLSATGAISLSTNGSTISIGAPAFSAGISSTLGNTAGTTGTVSNQLILAGGNNITLSQSTGAGGNTLSIIGGAGGGGGAGLSAGTQSVSTGTVNFANSNGITFGMSGSNQITASHNGLTSQSNQAVSGSNGSFTFQTLSLSNANGISFGTSAGSAVTASYTVPTQTNQTLSQAITGNTTGNTSGMSVDARSLTLQGLGAASVGLSTSAGGSSVIISAPTQTVQTQNLHNLTLGGNTAGVMAQVSSGTLTLAGGNNVTLSQNGNAITISGGAGGGAAGSNTFGMSNLGNTSGTTGVVSGSAAQLVFAGGNNVTLSQSINGSSATITVSAQSQSVQTQNMVSIGGSTGDISFGNANGITFGSNASTITASHNGITSQTNQTLGINVTGNTLQTNTGTVDARSLTFNGLGNVSVGYSNGSVQISGAGGGGGVALYDGAASISSGTAVFSDANNVIFGINGQTITASLSASTLSRYESPTAVFTGLSVPANSSMSLQHEYIPFYITGTAGKIAVSLTVTTFTSATTASMNYSLSMGLYTLNGSTLSLITQSSGTANNGFTWANTANAQYTQTITGLRQMTVPMNVNITPGEYWVGALLNTASTFTGASNMATILGNNQIHSTGVLGVIGSSTSAGRDVLLGQGIFATAAMPASIALSAINNTVAGNAMRANFYHAYFNTTY